jgi:uncharacterized protein YbjT (DUF2867 family)
MSQHSNKTLDNLGIPRSTVDRARRRDVLRLAAASIALATLGSISITAHAQATRLLEQPTLVIGGTGKTGRRIVERLRERGIPVRIGSRSAQPAFDWENQATWAAALKGCRAAYIAYYPDLGAPGAATAIKTLADQALASGVRRLVLLSGRGEEEAQRCEAIVKSSGADWTILRASWFSQNFSENFLVEDVLRGEVALPVGAVTEPFVDAEDIADVAVAALTDDRHIGQLYELTGPRLLTFADAVKEITKATGGDIRFVTISQKQFADDLGKQNLPEAIVALMAYLFTTVLDGRNSSLTDGVQRALGREPKDFAVYAREAAASGVWNARPKP